MQAATRRRILIVAVFAVVIIALIYGFMPKPVPVDLVKAVRGPMNMTIEEEGKTRVKDRFVVSAPVSGYMRRIDLEVGDRIKKGQVVAVLEPLRSGVLDPRSRAEAEASVAAAQSALNSAEEKARAATADAEYSRKSLVRQKKLYELGYIARDNYEQAETEMARSEANRLASEAAVKSSRAELARCRATLRYSAAEGAVDRERIITVRAPVEGMVLKLQRESEGAVNTGDPLVDIGNPGLIEVKVEVLSADAVMIKPGTPVLFERWGGDAPLSGVVRIVEPEAFTKVSSLGVEEQRVLVIADITSVSEEWKRLGDGYRVEAKFIIWEGKDVFQVPDSSLFRKGDGWAVFVNDNGRARQRTVSVGHRNGLFAEVFSGLPEGREVIVHPGDAVSDGVRIRSRQKK